MRHAICVIGFGENADVLQETIKVLDDKDIDFFIHWDIRYKIPFLKSDFSEIYFLKERRAVKWGSQSQIEATLALLKVISKAHASYDYIHLISCNDIPLMTKDYFKNYFTEDTYIGFDRTFTSKEVKERVGFWYPGRLDFRKHPLVTKEIKLANKLFNINRLRSYPNISFKKGPQWFSIKGKYISKILEFDNSIFLHGYCSDELFIQTVLGEFENKKIKVANDNAEAARYIDWERGTPYVFTQEDVSELKSKINTNYAFARKIADPKVVTSIFK